MWQTISIHNGSKCWHTPILYTKHSMFEWNKFRKPNIQIHIKQSTKYKTLFKQNNHETMHNCVHTNKIQYTTKLYRQTQICKWFSPTTDINGCLKFYTKLSFKIGFYHQTLNTNNIRLYTKSIYAPVDLVLFGCVDNKLRRKSNMFLEMCNFFLQ